MRAKHSGDPAKELLDKVSGEISKISIFGPKVLVAIYVRPLMTSGGILMPEKSRDEDIYQGKVGLVIKKGPLAFTDEAYFSEKVEVGDWVWFRASNGMAMKFNEVDCRYLEDIRVEGKINQPDAIW